MQPQISKKLRDRYKTQVCLFLVPIDLEPEYQIYVLGEFVAAFSVNDAATYPNFRESGCFFEVGETKDIALAIAKNIGETIGISTSFHAIV